MISWLTTQMLIDNSSVDWRLKCWLMTQVLIDNSSVDWRLKVWLMTQLLIVNSSVNWWLKCWLMTQIYGQKRLDLWPNNIVGMTMAIVTMLDFMSMPNGQHSRVAFATENGKRVSLKKMWNLGKIFPFFKKHKELAKSH